MNASSTPHGKSAGFRSWLARHLVAMVATAVVLVTLGWKNQYQWSDYAGTGDSEVACGVYGWPRVCLYQIDNLTWDSSTNDFEKNSPSSYAVTSWPALLFDSVIAFVSLIAVWILFSRTQRRSERWWRLSLASLLALVMLAAAVCAVLRSDSVWGW